MTSWRRTARSLRRGITQMAASTDLSLFPIFKSVRGYSGSKLADDARAGVNVALLAFPQGMAYAAIAGLPIQYGIFGSALAAIFGAIFGGSRFIALGPTNATSAMLLTTLGTLSLGVTDLVILPALLLLTGIFLILGAFFQVASLVQYVSRAVVAGYITAAAVYIITNQISKVLGFEFTSEERPTTYFEVVYRTVQYIPQTSWSTVVVSAATALTFIAFRKWLPKLPGVALTLVIMSAAAFGWAQIPGVVENLGELRLLTSVDATEWPIGLPGFELEWIPELAFPALIIAFLSVLEGTSIGKSLAAKSGARLNTNQEMLGMGVANVACAVGGGMPASGSLTRSALNNTSGARSALSNLINGLIVTAAAFAVGQFTSYIPVAVLGVLVISIGVSLINPRVIRVVTKATGADAAVFLVTFISALLLRLDFAILLGTATSIFLFLRKASEPELVEFGFTDEGQLAEVSEEAGGHRADPKISIVHVEGNLFFGAAELFRDQMRRICQDPNLAIVILKLRNAHHLDATAVMALEELLKYMNANDRYLLVSEVRKDAVRVFKNSGLLEEIGRDNIFPDNPTNPTLATARALRRANDLLGGRQAEVAVFVEAKKKDPTKG